jgi:hypothetical protein
MLSAETFIKAIISRKLTDEERNQLVSAEWLPKYYSDKGETYTYTSDYPFEYILELEPELKLVKNHGPMAHTVSPLLEKLNQSALKNTILSRKIVIDLKVLDTQYKQLMIHNTSPKIRDHVQYYPRSQDYDLNASFPEIYAVSQTLHGPNYSSSFSSTVEQGLIEHLVTIMLVMDTLSSLPDAAELLIAYNNFCKKWELNS